MTPSVRSVRLASRPVGLPTAADFSFVETDLPPVTAGHALVENVYLSVDPYMLGLMRADWPLDAAGEGRAVGQVLESADPRLRPGDWVFHWQGWRTRAVVAADAARVLPADEGIRRSAYLGILGGTGRTAYVGLTRIAELQPGETVFISSAAGGVGSAAGQLARLLGAGRVVGSAGSPAKVAHLVDELGFDAAFDYHDGPLADRLAAAAPDGIDVYFDNVGGEQLAAALGAMRPYGRIAWCGAIAQYGSAEPPLAPHNLIEVMRRNLRLQGFSVRDYDAVQDELERLIVPAIHDRRIAVEETIVEGFDQLVEAFLGLFTGRQTGKTIVRIRPE